jgi:hypothetical protein
MPNQPITQEIGQTGTYIVGGYLADHDYNAELTGWTRVGKYDQMRKGDATVRASLLAVNLPILSADWYIEPASEDAKDVEVADFVKKELLEGKLSWSAKLREFKV